MGRRRGLLQQQHSPHRRILAVLAMGRRGRQNVKSCEDARSGVNQPEEEKRSEVRVTRTAVRGDGVHREYAAGVSAVRCGEVVAV